MRRGYTLLALGLVLLGGRACWAGEIGAAQLPLDATPMTTSVITAAPGPAAPAAALPAPAAAGPTTAPAPPPVAPGAPCCGACCAAAPHHERLQRLRDAGMRLATYNMADNHHGECWQRLCDWLTYCPPNAACHYGCCSCCGHGKCTPCCMPPYMYFLDRCSCTLGYKPSPLHPPAAAPDAAGDQGAPGAPPSPATPAYGGGATAGR